MKLMNCRYNCSSGGHNLEDHPEADTLECLWNQGFYSNFSQTFGSLIILLRHGIVPSRVSYENGFLHFKNHPEQDIYPLFHAENTEITDLPTFKGIHIPHSNKAKGEFGKYQFDHYQKIFQRYFEPSAIIADKMNQIETKYAIDFDKTIAVLYRGTDKGTELKLATPEQYLKVVLELLQQNPGFKVWIQTDDTEALNFFVEKLGSSCFFIDETPTTDTKKVIWSLVKRDESIDTVDWAQWFDAALRCVSSCKFVVNHTGNVGLFLALYRGSMKGIYQFDEYGELIESN